VKQAFDELLENGLTFSHGLGDNCFTAWELSFDKCSVTFPAVVVRLSIVVFCAWLAGLVAAASSEPSASAAATPAGPAPRLVTRDIRVPPDYFDPTPVAPEPAAADDAIKARHDVRAYLASRGVVFPEGGEAILSNDGLRLTVHTAEEAVEAIRGIFWNSAPAWRPGAGAPAPQRTPAPDLIRDPAEVLNFSEDTIRRKLHRIIIPKLEFHNLTFREAIDLLWKKAVQVDRHSHRPLSAFVPLVFVGMSAAEEYSTRASFPPPPGAVPKENGFTASLTNISVVEALKYVTGLNSADFRIWPDGIHIRYWHGPIVMVSRDIRVPRDFFTSPRNPEQAEKAKTDVRAFLRDMGAALPEQATLILSDDATRLTVQVPWEIYRTIAEIFRRGPPWSPAVGYSGSHVPGPEVRKIEREPGDDARDATRRKMRSIILPEESFDNHPLGDVLWFLSYHAELADRHGPRGHRGLAIVVDPAARVGPLGAPDWEVPQPANPTMINYSAKRVSLGEIVEVIARQSHLYVRPQPYCVSFDTVAPDRLFVARIYAVPPTMFADPKSPPEWLRNEDPVGRDEDGRSYHYTPSSHRLFVRDTEARMAEVTKLMEEAWRKYYASDEGKKRKGR
jgi:hypothetical protein